jgi:hypothetical protein
MSDAFSLKQMAALVLRDNFQAGAHRETQYRDERVLEPEVIHVKCACVPDQSPRGLVTAKKGFENEGVDVLRGLDLLRRPSPCSRWIRRNVVANEPTAEPA